MNANIYDFKCTGWGERKMRGRDIRTCLKKI